MVEQDVAADGVAVGVAVGAGEDVLAVVDEGAVAEGVTLPGKLDAGVGHLVGVHGSALGGVGEPAFFDIEEVHAALQRQQGAPHVVEVVLAEGDLAGNAGEHDEPGVAAVGEVVALEAEVADALGMDTIFVVAAP